MGNCLGGQQGDSGDGSGQTKQYSWDKRPTKDPSSYTVKGLRGDVAARSPGSLDGDRFIVEDCKDSHVYIFDHTATVTVENCEDCCIFLGPITGSIFIRNSKNCKFILACQQFRTRDCSDLEVLICCTTLPIIESTSAVKFGCFRGSYFELEGQFSKAGVSLYNNNWSRIHDFTPEAGNPNWTVLPDQEPSWLEMFFSKVPTDAGVTVDTKAVSVPLTLGSLPKPDGEKSLIVFFKSPQRHAKKFLKTIAESNADIKVVQTKECRLEPADAERILKTTEYAADLEKSNVVILVLQGPNCNDTVKVTIDSLKNPVVLHQPGDEMADRLMDHVQNAILKV